MAKKAEVSTGVEEKERSFEETLNELEALTAKLEAGELPLEEALALYEQGVKLTAVCNTKLKSAKLKIEELKKPQNEE